MGWKRRKDFDHGGFWDRYSQRWETKGDGDGVVHEGDDPVLGVEWADDARTRMVVERFTDPYLQSGDRVLEIGPGGGRFSRIFTERGARLTLCDISAKMLERARQRCDPPPEIRLLDGEGLRGIADESFDLVFAFDVFIHLESEEIFRYFAEVNRVLRERGHFVVHTSNFESRYGFHSFFRQLRDHQPEIGSRYGGRMYPMTAGILRRFAETSGFDVADEHGDHEDRDLLYTLRKERPAFFWRFAVTPALYRSHELAERMGGGSDWDLFAGLDRGSGEERALLLTHPDHPRHLGGRRADVPEHPCLPRPRRALELRGIGILEYPRHRGLSLTRASAEPPEFLRRMRSIGTMLLEASAGLDTAHEAGLVHGALDPDSLFIDVERDTIVVFGLIDTTAAGTDDRRERRRCDREVMARLLERLPPDDVAAAAGRELADVLRGEEPVAGRAAALRAAILGL